MHRLIIEHKVNTFDRCPKYDSLPSTCYLVNSPDGCCHSPVCRKPDGSTVRPDHTHVVPGVFGSYNGGFTGFRPGYLTGTHAVYSGHSSKKEGKKCFI